MPGQNPKPKRSHAAPWVLAGLIAAYALIAGRNALFPPAPEISRSRLLAALEAEDPPALLDVRTADEYRSGHIPGAIHIHYRALAAQLERLARFKDEPLVVYCESGPRTRSAVHVLKEAGFSEVMMLEGDMSAWRRAGLPVERASGG